MRSLSLALERVAVSPRACWRRRVNESSCSNVDDLFVLRMIHTIISEINVSFVTDTMPARISKAILASRWMQRGNPESLNRTRLDTRTMPRPWEAARVCMAHMLGDFYRRIFGWPAYMESQRAAPWLTGRSVTQTWNPIMSARSGRLVWRGIAAQVLVTGPGVQITPCHL